MAGLTPPSANPDWSGSERNRKLLSTLEVGAIASGAEAASALGAEAARTGVVAAEGKERRLARVCRTQTTLRVRFVPCSAKAYVVTRREVRKSAKEKPEHMDPTAFSKLRDL